MKFYIYKIIINDRAADEIKVKLGGDLAKYCWVSPLELKEIKLTPPSVELFKKLGYLE
jgi:hypothetical protein